MRRSSAAPLADGRSAMTSDGVVFDTYGPPRTCAESRTVGSCSLADPLRRATRAVSSESSLDGRVGSVLFCTLEARDHERAAGAHRRSGTSATRLFLSGHPRDRARPTIVVSITRPCGDRSPVGEARTWLIRGCAADVSWRLCRAWRKVRSTFTGPLYSWHPGRFSGGMATGRR